MYGEWQIIDSYGDEDASAQPVPQIPSSPTKQEPEVPSEEPSVQEVEVEDEEDNFDMMDGPGMDRRDTFVGTPLYVSPEMLHETKSLPASDLWALGCIIYKMHTGKVPFEDRSETGTFERILNRQLSFLPEMNLNHETKDLIDRLLTVNPKKRLGTGRPGSENDLSALKNHPYFQGIDFATLGE